MAKDGKIVLQNVEKDVGFLIVLENEKKMEKIRNVKMVNMGWWIM